MAYSPSTFVRPFKPPKTVWKPKPETGHIPARQTDAGPSRTSSPAPTAIAERSDSSAIGKIVAQKSFYATPKPKKDRIVIGEKSNKDRLEWGGALHNPNAKKALVMRRPDGRTIKDMKKR